MRLLSLLLMTLTLASCASEPYDPEKAAAREDREYRTGSNIPRRDKSASDATVVSPEAIQRALDMRSPTGRPGG